MAGDKNAQDETEKEPNATEATEQEATGSDASYEVGYRKPPIHSRFKPGESGNRRGRPKGTKNLKTDLVEELSEKIVIREGDRSQEISKQRALVKSLVNGSIKGNARTTTPLLAMILRLTDTGEGAPEIEHVVDDHELEILSEFKARLKRELEAPQTPPSPEGRNSEGEPS